MPAPRSRQQSDDRENSKVACSHPDMSVQNCTDSQIRLSLYWPDKLTRPCSLTTNERQIALSLMGTFKEKTVSGQPPSRESATDASGQRDWLGRTLKELRQEADG